MIRVYFRCKLNVIFRVRIEMDLREALFNPLHLHTVCHRNQRQVAEEMVRRRNCSAAVQLWDVSVLKEQGREKKTHPIKLQEASKESAQEPHGESERERKGGGG